MMLPRKAPLTQRSQGRGQRAKDCCMCQCNAAWANSAYTHATNMQKAQQFSRQTTTNTSGGIARSPSATSGFVELVAESYSLQRKPQRQCWNRVRSLTTQGVHQVRETPQHNSRNGALVLVFRLHAPAHIAPMTAARLRVSLAVHLHAIRSTDKILYALALNALPARKSPSECAELIMSGFHA